MRRVLLSCVVVFSVAPARAADGPAKEVPELSALAHWEGRWETVMKIKPSPSFPDGLEVKGTAHCEWVLGGRFLRQSWETPATGALPKLSGSTMMTYDPARRTYRNWAFTTYGMPIEAAGTWDEARRSMTWTTVNAEDGQSTTTKATFAEDGTESWTIVTKDRAGAVVSDISGKNTKAK